MKRRWYVGPTDSDMVYGINADGNISPPPWMLYWSRQMALVAQRKYAKEYPGWKLQVQPLISDVGTDTPES